VISANHVKKRGAKLSLVANRLASFASAEDGLGREEDENRTFRTRTPLRGGVLVRPGLSDICPSVVRLVRAYLHGHA
jgi:hypothetical protein